MLEIDPDEFATQIEKVAKYWKDHAVKAGYYGSNFLFFYLTHLQSDSDRDDFVEYINSNRGGVSDELANEKLTFSRE